MYTIKIKHNDYNVEIHELRMVCCMQASTHSQQVVYMFDNVYICVVFGTLYD